MYRRKIVLMCATVSLTMLAPGAAQAADSVPTPQKKAAKSGSTTKLERGKYLVKIAGCNDCHTAGYMPNLAKWTKSNGSWATRWAGAGRGARLMLPTCGSISTRSPRTSGLNRAHARNTAADAVVCAAGFTEQDLRAIHAYVNRWHLPAARHPPMCRRTRSRNRRSRSFLRHRRRKSNSENSLPLDGEELAVR